MFNGRSQGEMTDSGVYKQDNKNLFGRPMAHTVDSTFALVAVSIYQPLAACAK